MDDRFMYLPISDKHKYHFCGFKFLVEKLGHY